MTVGFFYMDTGSKESKDVAVCAAALVRSVRRTMPGVEVVHLTDPDTKPIEGIDSVRCVEPEPMAMMRFRHQSRVDGDWLFVDSDVLFQRDVRKVFDHPFDVAVTTRNWKHLRAAPGFTDRMPFNTGVVFSRSRAFWHEALARLGQLSPAAQAFMGHQTVICDMVAEGRYHVRALKGSHYNCPPAMRSTDDFIRGAETVKKAAIVHYKGLGRKAAMLTRIQREAAS